MKLFSEWMDVVEGRTKTVMAPARLKKHKVAAVAHDDIDRWLKSVDGLAKDLSALQAAKDKAKGKMDQIGKKYKPEEKEKDTGKEEKQVKKPIEKKVVEKPVPEKPRFEKPQPEKKQLEKRPQKKLEPDIEEKPKLRKPILKRQKPEEVQPKPRPKIVKRTKQDPQEDVE